MAVSYKYTNAASTYTITDFIACQSPSVPCQLNFSFKDTIGSIKYSSYDTMRDYLDEIRTTYCKTIKLSNVEMIRYRYRPKILCYDVYGNEEIYSLILLINDMYDVKQFTSNTILLPTAANLTTICTNMYNANKKAISAYSE